MCLILCIKMIRIQDDLFPKLLKSSSVQSICFHIKIKTDIYTSNKYKANMIYIL